MLKGTGWNITDFIANFPATQFCQVQIRPKCNCPADRIWLMKNFNDIIRNQIRKFLAFGEVPKTSGPPSDPTL